MSSVADGLASVRQRIAAAAARAGRQGDEITLVGVGKGQPLERLVAAWQAGLRTFGENRVQEAAGKIPRLTDDAVWHLIGPLQSNKAKLAARLFDCVHSVDRPKIARVLDREAAALGRTLDVFVEVNLGEESAKHGYAPGGLGEQLVPLTEMANLRLLGLMAIPPIVDTLEEARPWFRQLRELRDELRDRPEWSSCPGLLSMGMSHDFEVAIEEGATHVRVGTAIFGPRGKPPV